MTIRSRSVRISSSARNSRLRAESQPVKWTAEHVDPQSSAVIVDEGTQLATRVTVNGRPGDLLDLAD
jgi:hypothetical protein